MGDKYVREIPLTELIPVNDLEIVNGDFSSNEYQMGPYEFNIRVNSTLNADTVVYLPPLERTIGGIFSILIVALDAENKLTVKKHPDDIVGVYTDTDVTAADDFQLLLNTGTKWRVINQCVT